MHVAADGHRLSNWVLLAMASGAAERSTTRNPLFAKKGAAAGASARCGALVVRGARRASQEGNDRR